MRKTLVPAAVALAGALLITGCAAGEQDDDCRTSTVVMFFSTADGHYHYGSPKGKVVPAYKVPASARKQPGYKPVGPVKPPAKVDMKKPGGSAPKAPAAPKPAAPRPPAPKVR